MNGFRLHGFSLNFHAADIEIGKEVFRNRSAVAVLDRRIPFGIHTGNVTDIVFRNVVLYRHALSEVRQKGIDVDFIFQTGHIGQIGTRHKGSHGGGHIEGALLNLNGIIGEHILFRTADIVVEPAGQGEHEAYADDADTPSDGGDNRSSLFGKQIARGKREGCEPAHTGAIFPALLIFRFRLCGKRGRFRGYFFRGGNAFPRIRIAVRFDLPVL